MEVGLKRGGGAASGVDTFGTCLGELIAAAGWSVRQLASALDVDASLVYRWLRNERTPRLNAGYAERIGELLALTAAERERLAACQAYSLRVQRKRVPHVGSARAAGARIETLVGQAPLRVVPQAGDARAGAAGSQQMPRLPREGVIRGSEALFGVLLDVLEAVPAPGEPGTDAILLSSQAEILSVTPEHAVRWYSAMREVLGRGWHVRHLWRLNRNVERSVRLTRSMLSLLGSGQYTPSYFNKYEALIPPYDLFIVPGFAALLLFATADGQRHDVALLTRDPEQIALFTGHFAQMEAQTRPLLQSFLPQEARAFGEVLVESEERFGGRVLVKHGLSLLTEPESWSREDSYWARRTGRTGEELMALIEQRKRRLAAFKTNVGAYRYRDICPMRAVQRMVHEGFYLRNIAREPTVPAPVEDRIEHLCNAIRVLREHENFELALVDAFEEAALPVLPETYWEVTGNTRALVNIRTLDAADRPVDVDIVIAESTISAAFQHYFELLWERIAPRNREKEFVISWLEQQLEMVR
jgi:hypothetical protein